jgi:hypothetical protein
VPWRTTLSDASYDRSTHAVNLAVKSLHLPPFLEYHFCLNTMSTHIYLSPHNDDVCFSLGHFAQRQKGDHLVNLYTVSHFIKARKFRRMLIEAGFALRKILKTGPSSVTELRNSEDRRFAEYCGLIRHDLALQEPSYRHLSSKNLKHMQSDINEVIVPLQAIIQDLASHGDTTLIFCPMGIGGHRNHLAVLLAMLRLLPMLPRQCKVLFYEDLPYASDPAQRQTGLKRFRRLLNLPLRRIAIPITPEEYAAKLALAGIYKSQFRGKPKPEKFIPCDSSARQQPHEAYWEIMGSP